MDTINLTKTDEALEDFRKQIYAKIDEIYSVPSPTAENMLKLARDEDERLADLIQDIYHGGKAAALPGLGADGVPYPELMWARWIGEHVERPTFVTIRQEAPRFTDERRSSPAKASSKTAGDAKGAASPQRTVGWITAVGGAAATVWAVTHTPVSVGLLALGIFCTGTGGYLIWKPAKGGSGGRSREAEEQKKERKAVEDILDYQRTKNKEQVDAWLKKLKDLIRDGVEAERNREGG